MARNTSVKERVLRIAQEKFLRHGFYNISMDSLVKELHTSKSSVYSHFVSKESLVEAILVNLNSEINNELQKIMNEQKLTFKAKLLAVSTFTRTILTRVTDAFLSDLEIHTPRLWEQYQRMRAERINKYYKALFKVGKKEGLIRSDLHPELILSVYMAVTRIPLEHHQVNQLGLPHEKIYEQVTEIFLNGVKKQR